MVKEVRVYWITIGLIGIFYALFTFQAVPWIGLLTSVLSLILCVFGCKKWLIDIRCLGENINFTMWICQVLLVVISVSFRMFFLSIIAYSLFVLIEAVRMKLVYLVSPLLKDKQIHAEEIARFNETFRIVRSERHDFLKHIAAIHYMMEKSEYEEAHRYLAELVEDYEETNLSIKGEKGAVAAILHDIYRQAKNRGIEVNYDIDVPLSTMQITDQEMVALLGNLLRNSVEACLEWQAKNKEKALITLQFYKRSGLFILVCKNNSLAIPNPVLDTLYSSYGKTTKAGEGRGYGTKIIDEIVRKYNGYLDFVHKEEEFLVKIKIPAWK